MRVFSGRGGKIPYGTFVPGDHRKDKLGQVGLEHSAVRGALMFPTYGGVQRHLHRDNIDGIRVLYGP